MPDPLASLDLEIRVRYAETDAMGYLHHSQYLVYFEMGRTELLRANGLCYRDMEERGLFYVVAKLEVRYRAPARYDDILTLTTATTRLSPVRVDHRYELRRTGQLLAEATSTLVSVDRRGRPAPMPEDWYAVLQSAGSAGE